jgi:tRNA dimethylallyltransferase
MVLSATSSIDGTLQTAPHVVVVAGPTATGKSRLAVKIASEFGGVVINADSQQRYFDLQVLSARPRSEDMAGVLHKLFGVLGPDEQGSAAEWARKAADEINDAAASKQLPIIVGGTGLYLRALMDGLIDVPPIPTEVRKSSDVLLAEIGNDEFYARLKDRDPATTNNLVPGDTHRLLRAWAVMEATGIPLSEWRDAPPSPPLRAKYHSILMMPEREKLYEACDTRFKAMVNNGVIDELIAFLDDGGSLTMPIMKMLGARELAGYLSGDVPLDVSIASAQQATRNYAKRQVTWFRHQFDADEILNEQLTEKNAGEIFSGIRQFLLS